MLKDDAARKLLLLKYRKCLLVKNDTKMTITEQWFSRKKLTGR